MKVWDLINKYRNFSFSKKEEEKILENIINTINYEIEMEYVAHLEMLEYDSDKSLDFHSVVFVDHILKRELPSDHSDLFRSQIHMSIYKYYTERGWTIEQNLDSTEIYDFSISKPFLREESINNILN